MRVDWKRRQFLKLSATLGVLPIAGCDRLAESPTFMDFISKAENLTRVAHRLLSPRTRLAREFPESEITSAFRANGSTKPGAQDYRAASRQNFSGWKLMVNGLVETPLSLSLAELRAMPARTQITRHDCVEGWSCIGKWTGAPLSVVLGMAKPLPDARYVVFHCYDSPDVDEDEPNGGGQSLQAEPDRYYESIDFVDAYHPQTILAYEMNGQPLPVPHGAPLRVRIERQLGYKMAKYLRGVELVSDLQKLGRGKGGYWEDRGYDWYAGI